ncbi:esterase/lipase family protein [Leptospira wolffii]|uniref:Esterase/lipase family protein n=1 Tax=Leptospira wolffii TaxID=409998 RepID=A0ABV5BLM7_9LEPT
MPYKPTEPSMNLSKFAVKFAKDSSLGVLTGIRSALVGSFEWTAKSLSEISEIPSVKGTGLGDFLKETGDSLRDAGDKTDQGMSKAVEATAKAMHTALLALDDADSVVKKKLFENIPISSIVGESFAGLVTTSEIQASFRLNGKDVSHEDVLADWKSSGLAKIMICVPGLFCDESLWTKNGETPLSDIMRNIGYYPVFLRFNPGAHISDNGSRLLRLLHVFLDLPELSGEQVDIVSYSQGGLVFRSALYQARQGEFDLSSRIRKAMFISSPDGGSYIEKAGFWLGLGAEVMPVFPLQVIGFIGNQRSDAMKDLSHGIIREEDWKNGSHLSRYAKDLYFGELDAMDAYQAYSLIAEEEGDWSSWIGDGIVEKPSLTLLSEIVYRKKKDPEKRVRLLTGMSHYQIIPSPELRDYFLEVFGS